MFDMYFNCGKPNKKSLKMQPGMYDRYFCIVKCVFYCVPDRIIFLIGSESNNLNRGENMVHYRKAHRFPIVKKHCLIEDPDQSAHARSDLDLHEYN